MYRTLTCCVPTRRSAALGAAAFTALAAAAAPTAQAAAPAGAQGDSGAATATVLRAGLDLSLLNRTVDVPVNLSLNDVRAPADARETALTVTVGHGVEGGRPVGILKARVATAEATADRHAAEGRAEVADARIHVPGLPLLALVQLDAVTSRATCAVGHRPTATSQVAGLTVLGRHLAVTAVGTTRVAVPGVGTVNVALTQTATTSETAAATALKLAVRIDPLSLGVAAVSGDVTIAQATCRTPRAQGGGSTSGGTSSGGTTSGGTASGGTSSGGASTGGASTGGTSTGGTATGGTSSTGGTATGGTSSAGGVANGGATGGGSSNGGAATGGVPTGGGSGSGGSSGGGATAGAGGSGASAGGSGGSAHTQTVADSGNLAETGASSSMPYLAGGAGALVAAGAAVFFVAGRRRRGGRAQG